MRNSKLHFIAIVLILLKAQFLFSQELNYKSLLEHVTSNKTLNEKDLIGILETSIQIKRLNSRDSLNILINQLLLSVENTDNKRLKFLFLLEKSRNLIFNRDLDAAQNTALEALKFEEFGKVDDLIHLNSLLGAYAGRRGEFSKALEWHQKALKLCESKIDKSCLAQSYTNIATIYWGIKDYEKVKDYSIKAYDIAEKTGNTLVKTRASTNTAVAFVELKDYKEAEKWFLNNLTIEEQDLTSKFTNYNNMGSMFEEIKDYDKSITYLEKAFKLSKELGNESAIALATINLARNYGLNKEFEKAELLFKEGLKQTKALGDLNRIGEAYLSLSMYHETMNKSHEALSFYKKYHVVSDSIIDKKQTQAIKELEIKYETQKKENELLKLSDEKQKNELLIAKQNRQVRQLSFGIGALVLLGILGFLLFKQRLQNKKQQDLLLAISETQTEERKRIAQDLHDSIGGSLALTKSKFETAKNKLGSTSKELDSALETLSKTTQQVRQISHNLMPGELVRFGLVAAINTLLENLNKEEISAQFNTNQNEERLEPLKEIQLFRIVQEALQNILKHSKAKNLFIQLNKHKDKLSLTIEDDGQGVGNEQSDGMGLKNIKQRVQLLKGIFTMDSSPERGTVLNIQIPT